jgi:hypothetical protein
MLAHTLVFADPVGATERTRLNNPVAQAGSDSFGIHIHIVHGGISANHAVCDLDLFFG